MPARLVGGLVGAVAGAHLSLCVLLAFRPFRAAGTAELVATTAAAGFALGWLILGRRLEAAGRGRLERRLQVERATRARSAAEATRS